MSDKIMVDRSVLEQALEALGADDSKLWPSEKRSAALEALHTALEQPRDTSYQEAVYLAKSLFKKHFAHEEDYASGRVVWELCDTTAGVISQIDNMVCTLVRLKSEDDKEYDWRDLYQKQKRRAEMWIAKYEKDVGMLDVAVPVCTHQQPVDDIVAGALFDFMGWLTTRSERLILSSTDLATPAVDAIVEFAEMRGLCLNDAQVKDWKDKTHAHIASSLKPNMSQR